MSFIHVRYRQILRHKHQDLIMKKETWAEQCIMKEIPAVKETPRVWWPHPWTLPNNQKGILFPLKFFFKKQKVKRTLPISVVKPALPESKTRQDPAAE